jgi:hypothetical protein
MKSPRLAETPHDAGRNIPESIIIYAAVLNGLKGTSFHRIFERMPLFVPSTAEEVGSLYGYYFSLLNLPF